MAKPDNPDTEAALAADIADVDELKRNLAKLKRRLEDQAQRIESLARGREEGMTAVSELRAELSLVAAERDRLRKQLTQIEGMQTETQTEVLTGISDETDAGQEAVPSIDELMATFSGDDNILSASHSTSSVESEVSEYQEMISPELIVLGSSQQQADAPDQRFLVLLASNASSKSGHTKCALDQDLLTIGRSDSADIKIEGDYISRIHARILRIGMDSVVEDAGSKNGTWVNGAEIQRHVLAHGDLIRVGSANFRYVDSAAGDSEVD